MSVKQTVHGVLLTAAVVSSSEPISLAYVFIDSSIRLSLPHSLWYAIAVGVLKEETHTALPENTKCAFDLTTDANPKTGRCY